MLKPNSSDVCVVLDRFLNDRRIFTKYDVTKYLRHEGFMSIHNEIRKLVDDELWLPTDYYITNYSSFGNPELYIPEEKDIDNYDPYDIPEFDVNNLQFRPTNTSKPNVKSLFDMRDRYSVKAFVTKQAGFNIGDVVRIITSGKNESIIITDKCFGTDEDRTATIDCYYNIRIPKSVFIKAFGIIPLSIDIFVKRKLIEILES